MDPGGRAEERTGLVYTCSITPDNTEELCGAVPGNDQTGVVIDSLTISVDNDFLSAGSRLFDQRRKYRNTRYLTHMHTRTCKPTKKHD